MPGGRGGGCRGIQPQRASAAAAGKGGDPAMAASSSHSAGYQLKLADRQRINALPSRSRTSIFVKYRDSLRSHKVASRSLALSQARDFRAQKNLLSHHSDEIDSVEDARAFCVPPHWVTVVDDLNRDVATIEMKSATHARPSFFPDHMPPTVCGQSRAPHRGSARRPPLALMAVPPPVRSRSQRPADHVEQAPAAVVWRGGRAGE